MSRAPRDTPESRLILEVIKPKACQDAARLAQLLATPELDQRKLEYWTAHHGASGFMVRSLSDAGLPVPAGLLQQARLVRLRNLMLTAALVDAVRALDQAGIPAISFKGPLLSQMLYGDQGLRPSNDIDLLVPNEQATRAREVLAGIGFSMDPAVPTALFDLERPHHTGLVRGNVRLEIHRRFFPQGGPAESFDELWASREVLSVCAYPVPVLGERHRILHLAIHGARHGFVCLKWLADLAVVLQGLSPTGCRELLADTRGQEYERAFLTGWRHLQDDLGLSLPTELREAVSRSGGASMAQWWFGSNGQMAGGYKLVLHRIRQQSIPRAGRSFLTALFRPNRLEWDLIPWLPPSTPIVFSLIRPFSLTWRLVRSLFQKQSVPI